MSTPSTIPKKQPAFVENVPAEIWTEIFLNTRHIPTTHNIRDRRELSCTRRSLFHVSQICSRLRAITIEAPRLWTWIFVDFRSSTPALDLYLTRLALQRSRTYPLSIFLFNVWELDPDPEDGAKYQCLVAVLSQIPRWKDTFLSWRARYDQFWSSMEHLIDSAPLLESLTMDARPDEVAIGRGLLPSKLWVASPRLRKLEVTVDVVFDYADETFLRDGVVRWASSNSIPYEQLTHLRLFVIAHEIVTPQELISIFSSSPNLISCFIENAATQDPSFQCVVPMLLQHLRHLYLGNAEYCRLIYNTSLSGLLDYITAPSLVTLTLASEMSWNFQAYKSFIVRSSCQLEELNGIDSSFRTTSDIFNCMELSPSLRAVHFHNLEIDELFSRMWTEWDATQSRYAVCPNLERLSVSSHALSHGLTQALSSRLHPPTGGSKTFSTLLIPRVVSDWDVTSKVRALCDEPSGLNIGFNDDMLKRGGFWDLYADR